MTTQTLKKQDIGYVSFQRAKNLGKYAEKGATPWNKGVPNSGFLQGYTPWNKGKKLSLKTRLKMSKSRRGENHFAWKGENAGYSSVHSWVKRWLGKPEKCALNKSHASPRYEWANRSHQYKRSLDDWIPLCASCHRWYDKHEIYI